MLKILHRVVPRFAFSLALMILFTTANAWSGSYKVLFNFTEKASSPSSGLVFDAAGNAYGVTSLGGHLNAGTAYELSPTTGFHIIFEFGKSSAGGHLPQGNLVLDSAGNLYGTTLQGGSTTHDCPSRGCGVVFELSPPQSGVGQWTETVLYTFCSIAFCHDGAEPTSGVIFDSAGNLYGTAAAAAMRSGGAVFKLTPSPTGWAESLLYSFLGGSTDGETPECGLVFDALGNLYGTTSKGGTSGAGIAFELSPNGSEWTETILHNFGVDGDGAAPLAGLALDDSGNLYGTTSEGGNFSCAGGEGLGCGVVFELTPDIGGDWTETILHTFAGRDGVAPYAALVLDPKGNLYGTTRAGGEGCPQFGCGTAFKLSLTPGGNWSETIFRFPGGIFGSAPSAPLVFDSTGNAYSTTVGGGRGPGAGVVFRITP